MIDKLAWIYIKNSSILSTRSKGKEIFYIPGGKREAGETDSEALIREIQEELSVDLHAPSLQFFGVFTAQADSHPEGVLVQMTCYTANYEGVLKASSEIEEVVWLRYKDINKISPVDKIIFEYLKKQGLLD